MALGKTQSLKEMSTRSIFWGKNGRCVRLTTLPPSCAVVMKSGNINFLELSRSLQACNLNYADDNSKAVRKGDVGLNAASRDYPLQEGTLRDTLMEQIIFLWKTSGLLPKDNWLTAFIIRPIRVCNQFLHTPNKSRCHWK